MSRTIGAAEVNELLAIQVGSMEKCVQSLEKYSSILPSDKNLARATLKFRGVLNEYYTVKAAQLISAPHSTSQLDAGESLSPLETYCETSSLNTYNETSSLNTYNETSSLHTLEISSDQTLTEISYGKIAGTEGKITPPVSVVSDDIPIQIPPNFHHLLNETPEEERRSVLDELKKNFSQLNEISFLDVNSHLDINLWNYLEILGNGVKRVNINLPHVEFTFLDNVMNKVLLSCPILHKLSLNLNATVLINKLWRSTNPNKVPGPALSVKVLHFEDRGLLLDIESLLNLFPLLENLSMPWRKHSNPHKIWKCNPKLQTLTLSNVKMDTQENCIIVLAQLVGYRSEEIQKVWDQFFYAQSVDLDRMQRIGSSITSLRELETLNLKSEGYCCSKMFEEKVVPVLLSMTSTKMPQLRKISM